MTKGKIISIIIIAFLLIFVAGIIIFVKNDSSKKDNDNSSNQQYNNGESNMNNQKDEIKINIIINNENFSATLVNNETTNELIKMFPMTITMTDLNNNEKYYYLSNNLPTASSVPSKINAGNLMLFGSDCLVLFYEDFNTSYSYTTLGFIDDTSNLKVALKSKNVTIKFELIE